jgi:hypothetical protein
LVLENNNTSELGKKKQWMEIEKELQKTYLLKRTQASNKITIELWSKR